MRSSGPTEPWEVTGVMSGAAHTDPPVIEVSHVSTRFGPAVVHEDVSLTVLRGEVFAIAGGNGCGKSTLLREIIGLLTPTTGSIRLLGVNSLELEQPDGSPLHRRFGVMFQHGALFSSMTLADNVAVPQNRRAWEELGRWQKPFLTLFSNRDPITRGGHRIWHQRVPGAQAKRVQAAALLCQRRGAHRAA